ncbi:DME family drug/metabolite transporter [Streptacidiphilus sp. MAP12-20]|uniref:DMT family transporter n=1 Tax=Streptacidiphilus sp. MAP12-20 TaxID=3156299 RepID=UPI003516F051
MSSLRAASVRPLLCISLSATSWGSAGAAAALLYRSSGLSPIAVSCWRFAIGGALLLVGRAFMARTDAATADGGRARPLALVATGLLMAMFQTCYLAAVSLAGLALGTAVSVGAGPVFTALGARLVFGQRIDRRAELTVLAAVLGLSLLVFGGDTGAGGSAPVWGFLCALGSAAGSAAINLLTQSEARRGRAGRPYDRALAGSAVAVACLLLTAAPVTTLLPTPTHLATSAALIVYLGAVPTALAYALFFSAMAHVRATTVSVVLMLEPLAALLLGTTLLGERLTPASAVGAAALLGVVLLSARESSGEPAD